MDPGYHHVVDVDGDGGREILIVGDTDEVAPSDLFLLGLRRDRVVNLVPPQADGLGIEYLLFDREGDGKLEIAAVSGKRLRILAQDAEGNYAEITPAEGTLDALWDRAVTTLQPYRPRYLLPALRAESWRPSRSRRWDRWLERLLLSHAEDEFDEREIQETRKWIRAKSL